MFAFLQSSDRGANAIVHAAISPELETAGGSYISNCRISDANALANDESECKKFFDFSCKLLKIERFGEP